MTIDSDTYRAWIERFDTFDATDLRAATEYGHALFPAPAFDVIMPVHDPPLEYLEQAIASIRRQTYERWRLCIVDDGSKNEGVRGLLDRSEAEDSRISVQHCSVQGGLARAINLALGMGSAEFVVFFDHDDLLARHALVTVADFVHRAPATNLLYSDFDFIDPTGARTNPFFKPDYDHEFHLGLNVVSNLTVYRRSLLTELKGFRDGFMGSEDYDLSLRAVEAIDQRTITHVPHVLYHWRIVETSLTRTKLGAAVEAARRAVGEHCDRTAVPSSVGATERSLIWNRVRALPSAVPAVTVVVEPPGEASGNAGSDRLRARTSHAGPWLEDPHTPHGLGRFRNDMLRLAQTELVAFVCPRLVPRHAEWLLEMTSHFARAATGVVGARIVGADGNVELSGIVLGRGEGDRAGSLQLARVFAGVPDAEANYFGCAEIAHRVAAVSGGALVVRKNAVEQVGGFDETIDDPVLLDVDACLRLRATKLSTVLCPYAVFETESGARRVNSVAVDDGLRSRFGSELAEDTYYNPNLSLAADYRLAFPPRVRFPWKRELPNDASGR